MRRFKRKSLRTALALLEVFLGTVAVTLALSAYLGSTALQSVPDTFQVVSGWRDNKEVEVHPLFLESKIAEVKALAPDVEYIAVHGHTTYGAVQSVQVGDELYTFDGADSVTADFADLMDLTPTRGSFFTEAERGQDVVVISDEAAAILFGADDPIGQTLGVLPNYYPEDGAPPPPRRFRVVGTFADAQTRQTTTGSFTYSYYTVSPLLYPLWLGNQGFVTDAQEYLLVKAKPGLEEVAREQVLSAVRQVYAQDIDPELARDGKDFYLTEPSVGFELPNDYVDPSIVLFGLFGVVSLVTGSIGLFSMLLVDALERLHELGIKRALGASRLRIVGELAGEAALLAFVGSLLGVLASALLIPAVRRVAGDVLFTQTDLYWRPGVALGTVLATVLLSALLSLLPAVQAVKMKPIEALKGA